MYPRYLYPVLLDALEDTPVVTLTGARQVGKSTLAKQAAEQTGASYLTLDDVGVLSAVASDPAGFVAGLSGPVVIDEVQRTPELLLAIKADVDRDRRPGRFLLTGSADVLTLPRIADSLAGRMEVLRLHPLSQGEIEGRREAFVDMAFGSDPPPAVEPIAIDDLASRLITGGYPEALARERPARRSAWFASYLSTLLLRDIQDLARIEGVAELPRLLQLLAARTSSLVNYAAVSRETGIPQTTLKRYLSLLEAIFLIDILPAWHANLGKRLVKSPKLEMTDTGLAASLIGADTPRLHGERKLFGQLLETFVALELAKQRGWSRTRFRIHHYRTQAGAEVDLLLEDAQGRLVGVEVKASATADAKDFAGLRSLAEGAQGRFHRGVVLYAGERVVPFGERLHALPIGGLWRAGAAAS